MLFVPAKISVTKPKTWYSDKAVRKLPVVCSVFLFCAAKVFIFSVSLKNMREYIWKYIYSHVHTCTSSTHVIGILRCTDLLLSKCKKKSMFYVHDYAIFFTEMLSIVQFSFLFYPPVYSIPSCCGRLCCCGPGGCFKRTCSICTVCTEKRWELAGNWYH